MEVKIDYECLEMKSIYMGKNCRYIYEMNGKDERKRYLIKKSATYGKVDLNPLTGDWTYCSEEYVGKDHFTIVVKDNDGKILHEHPIEVNITEVEVLFQKQADRKICHNGERIHYQFRVKNVGKAEIDYLLIQDLVPEETELVPHTVYIDGVIAPVKDLASGINLAPLVIGEEKQIEITVGVINECVEAIKQRSQLHYQGFSDNQTIQGWSEGNQLDIQVIDLVLTVNQKYWKERVNAGEVLEQQLEVQNHSSISLHRVRAQEIFDYDLTLISNSTRVNGVLTPAANLFKGIYLGNLKPGEKAVIDYNIKVNGEAANESKLHSKTRLSYQYSIDGVMVEDEYLSKEREGTIYNGEVELEIDSSTQGLVQGEGCIYSILLRNTGGLDLEQVNLDLMLGDGLVIQGDTLVAGEVYLGVIAEGILINRIEKGAEVKIEAPVLLQEEVSGEIITVATVSYRCNGGDNEVTKERYRLMEEHVIQGLIGRIEVEQVIEKMDCLADEPIETLIVIRNTGNMEIETGQVKASIGSGDGLMRTTLGDEAEEVFFFSHLLPGEEITCKSKAILDSFNGGSYKQDVLVEGVAIKERDEQVRIAIEQQESNLIPIVEHRLNIEQKVNKSEIVFGEEIEVQVTLSNDGDIITDEITLYSQFDDKMTLKNNQVEINGVEMQINRIQELLLGSLYPNEKKVIRYWLTCGIDQSMDSTLQTKAAYRFSRPFQQTIQTGETMYREHQFHIRYIQLLWQPEVQLERVRYNESFRTKIVLKNEGNEDIEGIWWRLHSLEDFQMDELYLWWEEQRIDLGGNSLAVDLGGLKIGESRTGYLHCRVNSGKSPLQISGNLFLDVVEKGGGITRLDYEVEIPRIELYSVIEGMLEVEDLCTLPPGFPAIDQVLGVNSDAVINHYILTNSTEHMLKEGERVAYIDGYMRVDLDYRYSYFVQEKKVECRIPFQGSLIIPEESCAKKMDAKATVVQLQHQLLNGRLLRVNAKVAVLLEEQQE